MKTLSELVATTRLQILRAGMDGGWAEAFLASSKKKQQPASIVFSWGGGWDHVSVSFKSRCPTWEEMCEVKNMFFHPEEVCVQYHPAESEYVNNHPYCLHLWKCQDQEMLTPPAWMVGVKKGQTLPETIKESLGMLKGGASDGV